MGNGMSESGYDKRPIWQWVLMYAVIAGVVYGLVYYFVFAGNGYSAPTSSNGTAAPYTAPI